MSGSSLETDDLISTFDLSDNDIEEEAFISNSSEHNGSSTDETLFDIDEEPQYDHDQGKNFFHNSNMIHPNLAITKAEVMMLLTMFYLRHNLSLNGLTDLVCLINSIFGMKVLPATKYMFQKIFPKCLQPTYHFFCEQCQFGVENSRIDKCENCGHNLISTNKKNNNFFVSLPIISQIKQVIERNYANITIQADRSQTQINDVSDGRLYQSMKSASDILNFTLVVNTDGVKIQKSKKKGSFYPIQFVINELDPTVRFKTENIIVCGFWYGSDINMELFFQPFVEEIIYLNKNFINLNINGEIHKAHITPIICTLDTVARDSVQRKIQFNGYNGCSFCHHPGTLHHKQIRYGIPQNETVDFRTHTEAIKDMKEAHETNKIVNGFKSISPFAALSEFDVINGFPPEYMHSICLGVVRQLADLWFESKHFRSRFYIGLRKRDIDKKLLKIRPPSNITRPVRSISEKANWKANEWRNWLLFYGPVCLHEILPTMYYKHFLLLSNGIFLLLKDNISDADYVLAKRKLLTFHKQFQILYGIQNMVYNVHIVSHIPESVKNCGPLWSTSCFHFEDNNGVLGKYVIGPTDVLKQISTKYITKFTINNLLHDASDTIKDYHKLIFKKNTEQLEGGLVKLLGKPYNYILNDFELQYFTANNIIVSTISRHDRFFYKRNLYHSRSYSANIKNDNSIVKCFDESVNEIQYAFNYCNTIFAVVCELIQLPEHDNVLAKCLHNTHLKPYNVSTNKEIKIIPVELIKEKCVGLVCTNNIIVISYMPNHFERD